MTKLNLGNNLNSLYSLLKKTKRAVRVAERKFADADIVEFPERRAPHQTIEEGYYIYASIEAKEYLIGPLPINKAFAISQEMQQSYFQRFDEIVVVPFDHPWMGDIYYDTIHMTENDIPGKWRAIGENKNRESTPSVDYSLIKNKM